ncbi:MAG TPA: YqgE/AlgH family protein [Acidimicrobiales bacterium]
MTQRIDGKLLVAEPMLGDPNFDRSVVLVLEHTAEGALGVVLNRPTELEVSAVLSGWSGVAAEPAVVYVGGPVEQQGVLALARRKPGAEVPGWSPVLGDVGTLDLHRDPTQVADGLAGVRFFAGYSGWDGRQLEAELAAGAWVVAEAAPGDVFLGEPRGMWRSVLARQGGEVSMLAHFPAHPSMN